MAQNVVFFLENFMISYFNKLCEHNLLFDLSSVWFMQSSVQSRLI